ncbi:hypothetical protein [Pragia fontium]|uniref:hypothetical protein n=1 Tax=Pragia fontium TaxID=82985 RepID=UPI000F6CBC84|nr:hypothetical protein [Pragia fontium]VEJ54613.1 Uncharacterised protein [Pragia fontium]
MGKDELDAYLQIQSIAFAHAAKQLKGRYPHQTLQLVVPKAFDDPIIIDDLMFLKNKGVLRYDPGLKVFPFELDYDHPVRLVMYYRGSPIGFAFGNVNYELNSIEILWMEKRNDAHEDLDYQFLSIVIDAYLAYAKVIGTMGIEVGQLALVGPIDGVIGYYQQSGFTFVSNYYKQCSAMVKRLVRPLELDLDS